MTGEPTIALAVEFVLRRFNAMLEADGARLDVVASDTHELVLQYVPGPDGACEACVLDPDDLDVLVAEALARQGAGDLAVTIRRDAHG
jgi:Fe-S cluster biogenesis protein NfuA